MRPPELIREAVRIVPRAQLGEGLRTAATNARGVASRIELELTWERIGCFRQRPGDGKSIVLDPLDAAAAQQLAVYRFDFLTAAGELRPSASDDEGEGNCYVGETTNLRTRLETYRYGRGVHGRLLRRQLLRHLDRHCDGSIDVFIVGAATATVDGQETMTAPRTEGCEFAFSGHGRLLFEQAAIVAMGQSGRRLINVPPELRHALAAEAKAIATEVKRAASS